MVNRTVCSALEEMRTCFKTFNFSYMPALIEEVQSMTNRMEAAIYDKNDLTYYHKELKEVKAKIKAKELELEGMEKGKEADSYFKSTG
jgi:hypothetical protein